MEITRMPVFLVFICTCSFSTGSGICFWLIKITQVPYTGKLFSFAFHIGFQKKNMLKQYGYLLVQLLNLHCYNQIR